ncbi:hypothetical protein BsIDN1_20040 [Bacillus safensis]|uniref:Uncharacterized protein n=1 Tax=Bacillus safensis TaxID=561879 RepID=A0A5S9MA23_BACIA|nr:hypothetical protein BsIDN1_20040 [Bacillus safensis]
MRLTGLFVSLAVAIYLWFDAPKHNKDKWLWAVLGVLFSTIVLGILFDQDREEGAGLDDLDFNHLVLSHAAHLCFDRCYYSFLSGAFMKKGLFFLLP